MRPHRRFRRYFQLSLLGPVCLLAGCGFYSTAPVYSSAYTHAADPTEPSCVCPVKPAGTCEADAETASPGDSSTEHLAETPMATASPNPAPVTSPDCCPQYCCRYTCYTTPQICPRIYISYYDNSLGYDPWWPYRLHPDARRHAIYGGGTWADAFQHLPSPPGDSGGSSHSGWHPNPPSHPDHPPGHSGGHTGHPGGSHHSGGSHSGGHHSGSHSSGFHSSGSHHSSFHSSSHSSGFHGHSGGGFHSGGRHH